MYKILFKLKVTRNIHLLLLLADDVCHRVQI